MARAFPKFMQGAWPTYQTQTRARTCAWILASASLAMIFRRETRRKAAQDCADASHRPRDVDPQTGEEPPADPES